jgi:hypothetical protein
MKRHYKRVSLAGILTPALLVFSLALPASAQDTRTIPIIIRETAHAITPPMSVVAEPVAPRTGGQRTALPVHRRPGLPIVSLKPDSVVQELSPAPLVSTTNLLNFDGVSDVDADAPPDTNASVGNTQVVETVNTSYQVFNKSTGASLLGPAEIGSLFSFLTGPGQICNGDLFTTGLFISYSDPVVLYDKTAGRWLISIVAFDGLFLSTFSECIGVSTTSDATGSYAVYEFSFGSNLNDYPKFGVWPDAYYASYNIFANAQTFVGPEVCAYDRAAMLAGASASAVCFQRGTGDASFLPSDLDGATLRATGEPNFYLELGTSSSLKLYKFHADFATPSNSTFTGPTLLPVASYTEACASTGTCIPQAATRQKLDSLGDRLMFRLAYRNFADHEALVATHSVKAGTTPAGVRWYEIRSPGGTPAVYQQGTLTSGGTSLWMGSIATDKAGDIAVGFSESSSKIHPSIGYTGRVPTDTLGTMESISAIFSGLGSQNGGLSRWGDYTSMAIDPGDDCTFWYANEYLPNNGSFNWNTRLAAFRFSGCQ